MAKPPTAVVMGVLLLPYVLLVSERPVVLAAIAIASAGILSLLTALAIDGSVPGFLARLALGQEIGAQLNAGYTPDQLLKRLDSLFVTSSDAAVFWTIFVAAALLAWLSLRDAGWAVVGRWLMMAGAAAATLLMLAGLRPLQIEQSLMQEIWLAAVPAGIVMVALACRDKVSRVCGAKFGTKSAISLVGALLLTPAAYAIGTGNNQWFQAAHLLIAWMAAAVVVPAVTCAPEKAERILSALALASAAVAGVLVSIGIEQPYRSAHGLRDQTAAAEVGSDGARLRLSPESADYVRNIRQAAYGNGFTEGTPVLDLTGRHPATVFVIGGSAPGHGVADQRVSREPRIRTCGAPSRAVPCPGARVAPGADRERAAATGTQPFDDAEARAERDVTRGHTGAVRPRSAQRISASLRGGLAGGLRLPRAACARRRIGHKTTL